MGLVYTPPSHVSQILENDEFWSSASNLVEFLNPIRVGDLALQSDEASVGTVYAAYATMVEAIEAAATRISMSTRTAPFQRKFVDAVIRAVHSRFEDSTTDLHFFAHVIDPENAAKKRYAVGMHCLLSRCLLLPGMILFRDSPSQWHPGWRVLVRAFLCHHVLIMTSMGGAAVLAGCGIPRNAGNGWTTFSPPICQKKMP
jgi:hypothetical protein